MPATQIMATMLKVMSYALLLKVFPLPLKAAASA